MPKILLIEDEPQMCDLLSSILAKHDFEVVIENDGVSGLQTAKHFHPDLIILDIIMPGLDGFEVLRRLQDDVTCAHIPIMVLTALATSFGLETATDCGADDFVTKPFDIQDIVTRANTLTKQTVKVHKRPTEPLKNIKQSRIISVYSLRGGLGCTALAVNLAFAIRNMWQEPTILLDGDFDSKYGAMALNFSGGVSWSDLLHASASNSVHRVLEDESIAHESGLHILTAPRNPGIADHFSPRLVGHTLSLLEYRYEYVIADLAHDLRGNTLELLRNSEMILYLLSSDPASLKLTTRALEKITSLGKDPADIQFLLVDTRPNNPIEVSDVERFIGHSISAYIPYAAEMAGAINRGLPFIDAYPDHEISSLTEDLAYLLSKPAYKDPTVPKALSTYQKPRPQLSSGGQNGKHLGNGRSLLKRMGLLK